MIVFSSYADCPSLAVIANIAITLLVRHEVFMCTRSSVYQLCMSSYHQCTVHGWGKGNGVGGY